MDSNLFSLQGRTALITGGSRGIGRMVAEGFVAQGATVYISARDVEQCHATAAELGRAGGRCVALPQDVSTVEGCKQLAAQLAKHESKLDVLLNNAGTSRNVAFAEFSEDDWDTVMDLNLKSPFFLTQALYPALRAAASRERPAKVINISSIAAFKLNGFECYSYDASKAALVFLTRRMAARLASEAIHVTGIAPGPFASDLNTFARDHGDALAASVPAGRIGREQDIVGAAIYLASRAGDFVVGDTLVVDGGVALASVSAARSATTRPELKRS